MSAAAGATPRITVTIGASGSGKTLWRRNNPDRIQQPFHDLDEMTAKLDNPGTSNPRAIATRRYEAIIDQHLESSESFGFETVYTSKARIDIIRRAKEIGYQIDAFFLATEDPVINIERVDQRFREGGHHVPREMIQRHWSAALENLIATWPLFSTIELYDTTEPDEPRLVARKTPTITYLQTSNLDPVPAWLAPVAQHFAETETPEPRP